MGGNVLSSNVLGPGISAVLTTAGDLLYVNAAGELVRLPIGSAAEVLTVVGGLPDWEPAPVGVSGWEPDNPPASPGAIDDEFSDGVLGPSWSEYDPDGKTTWSEGDGGAKAVTATLATLTLNGIYQTLPAGDFTVWAKVGILHTDVNYSHVGLNLWADPTGNNKQGQYALVRDATTGAARLVANEWTNRSTAAVAKLALVTVGYSDSIYLRLRRNAANYYLDYSMSGLGWRSPNGNAAITWSFTPTKIGLSVLNYNTLLTATFLAQFFRYVASDVTLAGVMAGNR